MSRARHVVVGPDEGELPAGEVGRAQPEDRVVGGPGDHHPIALGPQEIAHLELDGKGLLGLLDGGPGLGRAHPTGVDPPVPGIEEHRLVAVPRRRGERHTGAVGEFGRVEGLARGRRGRRRGLGQHHHSHDDDQQPGRRSPPAGAGRRVVAAACCFRRGSMAHMTFLLGCPEAPGQRCWDRCPVRSLRQEVRGRTVPTPVGHVVVTSHLGRAGRAPVTCAACAS